jgi:manganese/iron transport system ATP-binding protein
VLISTHDLALAGRIADRVCLLNGRLWACGAPEATLTTELLRRTYGSHAVDLPGGRAMVVEP